MLVRPPATRNSPCPCGSGRRFKDCHGSIAEAPAGTAVAEAAVLAIPRSRYRALADQWVHLDGAKQDRLGAVMEEALARQTEGRNDEAARLYRNVLAEAPRTHDALHMLGVIELGLGDFDEAEALILAAMELQPSYAAIETNLGLVRSTRLERSQVELEELCTRALPIFCDLVSTTWRASRKREPAGMAYGESLHLIGRLHGNDEDDPWCLRQLAQLLAPLGPQVWAADDTLPFSSELPDTSSIDAHGGKYPRGGTQIFVGIDYEIGAWVERGYADRVIVLCGRGRPSAYLEQLRAIASDGARRVELAFTSQARADRFGRGHLVLPLPGLVIPAPFLARDSEPVAGIRVDAKPDAWVVGMVGQLTDTVDAVTDDEFLEQLATTAGKLRIYDPGRYRFALGDSRSVQFVARSRAGLAAFIADVGCLFCRAQRWWEEGLGREIVLAMALGRPVICSRASIHANLIDDRVDGLLYTDDAEALELIAELRRAPAWATEIGHAGQQKARALIDPAAAASAYRLAVSTPISSDEAHAT